MSKQHRIIHLVAGSAMAWALSCPAQAGATRTFVSTNGDDSNTAVDCPFSANCRTFNAALSVTNAGGEVVVMNSGGYGPATISQPVIITAIGVDASISVTITGGVGLTITTPGNVTLIGLSLHGEAAGFDGIQVNTVGVLRLYNVLIENFLSSGVDFLANGKLAIYNSTINDNGAGIFIDNASAKAYVQNTYLDGNRTGVQAFGGDVTVTSSSVNNGFTGLSSQNGTLTLFGDRVISTDFGLSTSTGALVTFAACMLANNAEAYSITAGSMAGTTPGTSLIAPGQMLVGTLSTPIPLQ
jgi:Right handed beta helix region